MFGKLLYFGFQGVDIDGNQDVLIIKDWRLIKHFTFILIVLIIAFLIGSVLYQNLEETRSKIIAVSGIAVVGFIACAVRFFQIPYRRIYLFDKKQGIYRLIEVYPYKNNENIGKLGEIKKVQTDVYRQKERNPPKYIYQTSLVLQGFPSDSLIPVPVDEESSEETTSSAIAFAIAEFLQVPFDENRYD